MRRPRRRGPVLNEPPADEPLPQAWVPRVVNLALAALLLLLLGPIVTNLDGKPGYVQVAVVLFSIPFALLALACLCSAARPGSLGRALRRRRRTPPAP